MNQNYRILSLNRNQLKYLVIIAMLIDHIAWAFVPMETALGQIMHLIGRLTGPTMAFFLVEGYVHTHDLKKYMKRLLLFTLVSWAPFVYFEFGLLPVLLTKGTAGLSNCFNIYLAPFGYTLTIVPQFGVIYTLLLALIALWVYDRAPWNGWCKGIVIAVLCLLSLYGDWPVFDIVFALILFGFRDKPKKKWIIFSITAVALLWLLMGGINLSNAFQLGVLLVPVLLHFGYNGEGGSTKAFHKWFFYIFYPLHLLILGLIKFKLAW